MTAPTLGIAGDASAIRDVYPHLPGSTVGVAGLVSKDTFAAIPSLCGIAGDVSGATYTAIPSMCGVAGLDTSGLRSLPATMAVAGLSDRGLAADATTAMLQPERAPHSTLGDRVAQTAGRAASWLITFYFALCPDGRGGMRWRSGREALFGPGARRYPVVLDSGGFGRDLTRTAPTWAATATTYYAAIETAQPDAYMAYDYPLDRATSLAALRDLIATYPGDVGTRLWPVFSARWAFDASATATFERLPGWASRPLARYVPFTATQRPLPAATVEAQARLAIAQALLVASDPDFLWMVRTCGRVAIGGLVKGPIPRLTRHLYAHVLATLFPDTAFWLLGQASAMVVNGLGLLADLGRVSCDGSWWIKDATAHAWAYVHRGLITTQRLGVGRDKAGRLINESFFTTREMMAANLRSLLAAYAGELTWPRQLALPIDPRDVDALATVRTILRAEQLALGL